MFRCTAIEFHRTARLPLGQRLKVPIVCSKSVGIKLPFLRFDYLSDDRLLAFVVRSFILLALLASRNRISNCAYACTRRTSRGDRLLQLRPFAHAQDLKIH